LDSALQIRPDFSISTKLFVFPHVYVQTSKKTGFGHGFCGRPWRTKRCNKGHCGQLIIHDRTTPGMHSGQGDVLVVIQSSYSFTCCTGMQMEITWSGELLQRIYYFVKPQVKDAIRAKKVAYEALLHKKADSSLHSWYVEARTSSASR